METASVMTVTEKHERLCEILRRIDSALIGFSGGVDSTLLLKVAVNVLGDRVLAVTGRSAAVPPEEIESATALAKRIGARHLILDTDELSVPGYVQNASNRCYFCKHELYTKLTELARREGFQTILDGTNLDDVGDHRPGMMAAAELQVRSPLKEAGLTKADIRELSRQFDLPTWDKPAAPCLASRIAYGVSVTPEALTRVWEAERFLRELGFRVLRVRYHDKIARIEVPEAEMAALLSHHKAIVARFKAIGFQWVTLDLQGFRSGSLNEVLGMAPAHPS